MITEQLHGEARLQVARAKMDGHLFDKALTRWNDIVETAQFYNDPHKGLLEAIECCILGNIIHIAHRGPLTMIEMFK